MPTQRGTKTKHTGVFRREDGAWLVQVTLRDRGRFRSMERTLPATTTESEAVAFRAQLKVDLERARSTRAPNPPRVTRSTTVSDYCEQWVKRKRMDWRPKTLHDNVDVLADRVLPIIGHIPLKELQRADIMSWCTWAQSQRISAEKPYADGTLALWWRVMRGMLNDMIADHELSPSLTFRIKPPRSGKPRVKADGALTMTQLRALLQIIRAKRPAWYAEVYLMAMTGMRPGELYALTWEDVDLENGTVTISKSVVKGKVDRPKNGRTRVVALTETMVTVLRDHRTKRPGPQTELLFASMRHTFRDVTTLKNVLVECGHEAGIAIAVGPQILRYTANTLMREAGIADEIVRDRLGHMTREMGHRYFKGHLDAQRTAVAEIEGALH